VPYRIRQSTFRRFRRTLNHILYKVRYCYVGLSDAPNVNDLICLETGNTTSPSFNSVLHVLRMPAVIDLTRDVISLENEQRLF